MLFSGWTKYKIPYFLYTSDEKALIKRIENLRTLVFDEMDLREKNFEKDEANGKNDFMQV